VPAFADIDGYAPRLELDDNHASPIPNTVAADYSSFTLSLLQNAFTAVGTHNVKVILTDDNLHPSLIQTVYVLNDAPHFTVPI
jgi:hypothetical protein